jgi:ubiquinone/menaquinone biosynthesis C-methylase UbiE
MAVESIMRDLFAETADIETSSEHYAQRFSGKVGNWFLQVQEEATLRMLAPYPGTTILDVGGGHGQLTAALINNDFDVTVLGSAEVCKQRILPYLETHRCTFEIGNFLRLPFPDQSFGVVISYRLLPYVEQWRQFLSELTRVAEKAVIIDYSDVYSFQRFELKKRLESGARPYTCFRHEQLLRAFRDNGFVQADRYTEFFLPMFFHRKLQLPRFSQAIEKFSRQAGLTNAFGAPAILKVTRGSIPVEMGS